MSDDLPEDINEPVAPAAAGSSSIDINTMRQYILVGLDAEGKSVSVMSPNMTITDLGGYIGRLQAMLNVQTTAAGMQQFTVQHQRSKVVVPGSFRKT